MFVVLLLLVLGGIYSVSEDPAVLLFMYAILAIWCLRLKGEIVRLKRCVWELKKYSEKVDKPETAAQENTAAADKPETLCCIEGRKAAAAANVSKKTVSKEENGEQKGINNFAYENDGETDDDDAADDDFDEEAAVRKTSGFLGQNLIVWLAGGAAVLGAFYLIRYCVEHGVLSPAARLISAVISGFLTVGGGMWLFKKEGFANHCRIGQALMGAGLAMLYFAAYAACRIYLFVPEGVSFALMCVITAGAAFLSLKAGGIPVMLMALSGGFLSPMLVKGMIVGTPLFTGYMILLAVAGIIISAQLASLLLLCLTLSCVYLWILSGFLFFNFGFMASLWLMLELLAVTAAVFHTSGTFGETIGRRLNGSVFTLWCLFSMAGLFKTNFGLLEWGELGAMLLAVSVLTVMRPQKYLLLFCCLGILVGALMFWTLGGAYRKWIYWGISVSGLLAFYVSLFFKKERSDIGACLAFAVPLLTVGWLYMFGTKGLVPYVDIGLGLGLLLPVFFYRGEASEDKLITDGCLVLSAVLTATVGLCLLLAEDYFPVVAAVEVLLFCFLQEKMRFEFAAAGMVAALLWYVFLMHQAVGRMLWVLGSLFHAGKPFQLSDLSLTSFFLDALVPMLCFAAAMRMSRRKVIKTLTEVCLALVAAAAVFMYYIYLRMDFTGALSLTLNIYDYMAVTLVLLAVPFIKLKGAGIFLTVGCLRELAAFNVLFDSFWKSEQLRTGGVLLTFGVPMILFAVYAYQNFAKMRKLFLYAAAACSFALVTALLNVWFSDVPYWRGAEGHVFAYSAFWLFLGVVWLKAAFYDRAMVLPAFGLIYFVIGKVFLYDVAALNDFWRIVALFGLAGSLLAISHFYAKYFNTPQEAKD